MLEQEKEKNFVSAVIYVHGEAEPTKNFIELVMSVLEENFLHSEIILVNDDAPKATVAAIKEISKKAKNVSISMLNMSSYHGLELAMTAGVDLAIGDFVFELDTAIADFPPELIIKIYKTALSGYDIVAAAPTKQERITSKAFYYLFAKFASCQELMRTERFRILSRRAINRVSSMNKTVPYRKAVYKNSGLAIKTIAYEPSKDYKVVYSKDEERYRRTLAVDAILLFTNAGYRLSTMLTSLMMLLTLIAGAYGLITYVVRSPIAGWTTMILFMSGGFFALFFILSIVIKYLQLILNLVFKRQEVFFEGLEKLTR